MIENECESRGGASGSSDHPSEGGTGWSLRASRSGPYIEDFIPCCVQQLLTATLVGNVFKVSGVEVIRKVERAPYYIHYKIDDLITRPIGARSWLGRERAKQVPTLFPVGVYARVLNMLVVEDMKEYTVHIQETVDAHRTLTKALRGATGPSAPVSPSPVDEAPRSSKSARDFIRKAVLRVIDQGPRPEGTSVRELQSELSGLSVAAIQEALVQCHIHSTGDREHFPSAH